MKLTPRVRRAGLHFVLFAACAGLDWSVAFVSAGFWFDLYETFTNWVENSYPSFRRFTCLVLGADDCLVALVVGFLLCLSVRRSWALMATSCIGGLLVVDAYYIIIMSPFGPVGMTSMLMFIGLLVPLLFFYGGVGIAAKLFPARPIPGHCEQCAYDLRGSPASDRCPECGTVTGNL